MQFLLVTHGKRRHVKRRERAKLGGCSKTKSVLTRHTIRRDFKPTFYFLIDSAAVRQPSRLRQHGHRLDGYGADSGLIKYDLPRLLKMRPLDDDFNSGAALCDPRGDTFDVLEHCAGINPAG